MSDESWLTKTELTARVALPEMTELIRAHKAEIPKQRRKEKTYATLGGFLLCVVAWLGYYVWEWSAWVWGPMGYFGANYMAGDYRRLFFRSTFAILKDTATFVTQAAAKLKDIKTAIKGLTIGKDA